MNRKWSIVSNALISMGVSVLCLFTIIHWFAGTDHFGELVSFAGLHIVIISLMAGIVRLAFPCGGFKLSAVCGAAIAIVGFCIIWAIAMSNV